MTHRYSSVTRTYTYIFSRSANLQLFWSGEVKLSFQYSLFQHSLSSRWQLSFQQGVAKFLSYTSYLHRMSDGDSFFFFFFLQLWDLLYILETFFFISSCHFCLAASVDALYVLAVYPIYHFRGEKSIKSIISSDYYCCSQSSYMALYELNVHLKKHDLLRGKVNHTDKKHSRHL